MLLIVYLLHCQTRSTLGKTWLVVFALMGGIFRHRRQKFILQSAKPAASAVDQVSPGCYHPIVHSSPQKPVLFGIWGQKKEMIAELQLLDCFSWPQNDESYPNFFIDLSRGVPSCLAVISFLRFSFSGVLLRSHSSENWTNSDGSMYDSLLRKGAAVAGRSRTRQNALLGL
ncbi:hypothetical protein K456DRAFT_938234 [Colletotrichum gloeosporioides 23]|nr:hypothetical protein K456DRAFT_938234 [Colletotrichum gloeosporioides 23]